MMQQKIEIKRAAIYTRKSVEEGLEQEFNSLDAQREAGEAYVKSQKANGWVLLPDRYDDGGFSGGNLNRPALKRLMPDREAGKVDIIVVYKIDRLSRSICDFAELSRQLDRMNVAFVSVTQEINTHTSAGRMMLNILLTFAQFEREVITERVRDKMRASRLKGKWVGGNAAYGYKVENHRLVPVPEELPILERIYRRFTEVQSTRQIAYELNNDGIPWRRGKAWTPQHTYRILTNVTYLGTVDSKGEIVQGEHAQLIDKELWETVRDYMAADCRTKPGKERIGTEAMLAGILRCGCCGGAMTPSYTIRNGRKYCYYLCSKDEKRAVSTCPIRRVPAGEIEKIVFSQIADVMKAPEMLSALSEASGIPAMDIAGLMRSVVWDNMMAGEKHRLAELLVVKAEISLDGLEIEFRTSGIKNLMVEDMEDEEEND